MSRRPGRGRGVDVLGACLNDPALSVVLRAKSKKTTRTVGMAVVANGVAAISFRLPRSWRGRRVYIQAKAAGPSYLTKTSAVQSVRVR